MCKQKSPPVYGISVQAVIQKTFFLYLRRGSNMSARFIEFIKQVEEKR